jgi:3-methyladenine DNA glycosylase AlkC
MAESFSLADDLFNAATVGRLADLFAAATPAFPRDRFVADTLAPFPGLALKDRIRHIAATLDPYLPRDDAAAFDLIVAALPPPLDPTRGDGDFGHFIFAPLGEIVAARMDGPSFDRGMAALCDLTQRFSMEFAIRPVINRWPDRTLGVMSDWARHPHYHVRRLVSEGTRPRLPWGAGITLAPGAALPLLDRLHADPARFVTRSVANHLNDIARTDADLVLATLARWRAEGRQRADEIDWMARHALRGLVRAGHAGALAALGFAAPAGLSGSLRVTPAALRPGEALTLVAEVTATTAFRVNLDYVIDFARPTGRPSPRVYRIGAVDLTARQPHRIEKRHLLRAGATTLPLFPGAHRVALRANGTVLAEASFDLTGG